VVVAVVVAVIGAVALVGAMGIETLVAFDSQTIVVVQTYYDVVA